MTIAVERDVKHQNTQIPAKGGDDSYQLVIPYQYASTCT